MVFSSYDEKTLGCGNTLYKVDDHTWFTFYIPLAMLGRFFVIDYSVPIGHPKNAWTAMLDEALVAIGKRMYTHFPFHRGLLGEEATSEPVQNANKR